MSTTTSETSPTHFPPEDDVAPPAASPTPKRAEELAVSRTSAVQASGTVSEFLSGVMNHLGAHGSDTLHPRYR